MDYKKLLNDKQYQAVSTTSQYVRIVAGAGSGKTRTLTYRIAYLIGELGFRPSSLLAITFTNKAAGEMKERAVALVPQAKGHLQISTFHSFCARFLRQEIDELGYSTDFQIIDDEDQEKMIKAIAVRHEIKKNDPIVKHALSFIGYHKCAGRYPEDVVLKDNNHPLDKTALEFFKEYENDKEQMNKIDFDDLLLKTIIVLEECPSVREKWQRKFSNILIDEFQDTNDVQFKLVKLLMNGDTNLYVVGDPDQTIYTWRGANQDIILKYELTFPGAETIILNENYRSTQNILDTANKLIAFNTKRVPKDLYTSNKYGDKVQYQSCMTREIEASNIAQKLEILKRIDNNFKYSDVLVLYRALYLTQPIEKEFMKRRLPYKIYGGVKFFQRKEIKDVLAYLNLFYNPKDDLSFERIVNTPKRDIGEKTISILLSEKTKAKMSCIEYISNIDKYDTSLKTKHIIALQNMIDLMCSTRNKLNENFELYSDILNEFLLKIGYYTYLEDDEDGDSRIKNVKSLLDDMLSFLKKNPESSLSDYLENAALQTSQDEVDDGEHISLMTIHIAKGLEYKYVFIIGLNQGVFPSDRTTIESGDDGMEEERRLCYVAFTRAKEHLYLSSNRSYSYILKSEATESQFIKEAGLSKNIPYQQTSRGYQPPTPAPHKFNFDFQEEDEEISIPKQQENGIKDWKIGDKVSHEKFGKGVVIEIVDDSILKIEFDGYGLKQIMSTHKALHRDKGGLDA